MLWASSGRSAETAQRAEEAGLRDVGTVEELAESSDIILSVCPPHGALAVAESIAGFNGIYVDANAVSPMTARQIASIVEEGAGNSSTVGSSVLRRATACRRASTSRAHGPRRRGPLSRHRRPGPGRLRRARLRIGGEDGVRRLDQGHRRSPARNPGGGSCRRRRGDARSTSGRSRFRTCPNDPTERRSRPARRVGDGWGRWRRSPARSQQPGCQMGSTRPRRRSIGGSRS